VQHVGVKYYVLSKRLSLNHISSGSTFARLLFIRPHYICTLLKSPPVFRIAPIGALYVTVRIDTKTQEYHSYGKCTVN